MSTLQDIAERFHSCNYLDTFEHLLCKARTVGCRVIVLSSDHFHFLAAALSAAGGNPLFTAPAPDYNSVIACLQRGMVSDADAQIAADMIAALMPHYHDGDAVNIDGERVRVVHCLYRGMWAGFELVVANHNSTVTAISG